MSTVASMEQVRRVSIKSTEYPDAARLWVGHKLIAATCLRCGEMTDFDDLQTTNSKVGKRNSCKPCARRVASDHYGRNKRTILQRQAEYRQENVEEQKERWRRWYERNRDSKLEQSKAWRQANPGRVNARNREWRLNLENLEKARESAKRYRESELGRLKHIELYQARRAKIRELNCGCVSSKSLSKIWEMYGGKCSYCEAPAEHFDHEVPISRGGPHCVSNLRPACASCNLKKSAKSLSDFLRYMGKTAHPPVAPPMSCNNQPKGPPCQSR